jgi:hypothetical protein
MLGSLVGTPSFRNDMGRQWGGTDQRSVGGPEKNARVSPRGYMSRFKPFAVARTPQCRERYLVLPASFGTGVYPSTSKEKDSYATRIDDSISSSREHRDCVTGQRGRHPG